jgi:hypothetical protein
LPIGLGSLEVRQGLPLIILNLAVESGCRVSMGPLSTCHTILWAVVALRAHSWLIWWSLPVVVVHLGISRVLHLIVSTVLNTSRVFCVSL